MIETQKISDPIQRTASQFGLQHFAATLEPNTVAGPFGGMETAVGDRSPLPSAEHQGFEGDNFRLARTVARGGLCSALFFGTGSCYKEFNRLPGFYVITSPDQSSHRRPTGVTAPSRCLAVIRAAFPLQILQIAEILVVSRPTIYAWIGGEQQPQSRCQARLNQVYALAEFWNEQSHLPLPVESLISPDQTGISIMDMLKAGSIDTARIKQRLSGLATAVTATPRRMSLVEEARKRGIVFGRMRENTAEFDVITRRPMDES